MNQYGVCTMRSVSVRINVKHTSFVYSCREEESTLFIGFQKIGLGGDNICQNRVTLEK